jgi:hypothetical protein
MVQSGMSKDKESKKGKSFLFRAFVELNSSWFPYIWKRQRNLFQQLFFQKAKEILEVFKKYNINACI